MALVEQYAVLDIPGKRAWMVVTAAELLEFVELAAAGRCLVAEKFQPVYRLLFLESPWIAGTVVVPLFVVETRRGIAGCRIALAIAASAER